jgi:Fe-S-cluster containining protein
MNPMPRDEAVTRADLERAIRHLNLSDLELRDNLLQLAARVVALTDELTRRLDGVEPVPAPPNTPAPPPTNTVEGAVDDTLEHALVQIRANDAAQPSRVSLDLGGDKYTVTPSTPPCDELLPICQARCCTLTFALSTADLDEGVIRWDYGQPYLIRQRKSDGYCVHNDATTRGCTAHEHRPRVCRVYDCRTDKRIWADFDKRELAPAPSLYYDGRAGGKIDLMERLRRRSAALQAERDSMARSFADDE